MFNLNRSWWPSSSPKKKEFIEPESAPDPFSTIETEDPFSETTTQTEESPDSFFNGEDISQNERDSNKILPSQPHTDPNGGVDTPDGTKPSNGLAEVS